MTKIKSQILGYLFALSSLLVLVACNEGGSGNQVQNFIPDIDIECSIIQSADCANGNTGKSVFVGLIADLSLNCEDYLLNTSSVALQNAFDALGESTVSFTHPSLNGFVTQWVNPQGTSISELTEESTYLLCAFIDINGNGQLDSGEPFGADEVTPGSSSSVVVTDWADAQ